MKRLHLGQIPDDFSPERDAFLSISSFWGRESVYSGWEDLVCDEVYSDIEEQMEGYNMLRSLANDYYLPKLSHLLNRGHQKSYGIEFWGILLKQWLFLFLNMSWFLYSQLNRFIAQNPVETFEVELLIEEYPLNFEDTQDFILRGYRDGSFHHWLLSLFLNEIQPQGWILISRNAGIKGDRPIPIKKNSFREYLKERIKGIFFAKRCIDVYGLSRLQQVLFSLYLGLKPIGENKNVSCMAESSASKKKNIIDYFPAKYLKVIDNHIEKALPRIFSEGFETLYARKKKFRYIKNRSRLIGPVWCDDRVKMFLAIAKERGERIVCTQHGCTYGIAKIPNLIPDQEYVHDSFFSWGWKQHHPYPVNAFALPSPLLSKLKRRRRVSKKSDKLVFVGTLLSPFELRFDILPKGKQLLNYRIEKLRFLSALSSHIFEKTYYRPIPVPSDFQTILREKEYLRDRFPKLKFIEGMPAPHPEMLKCKLLVLDNPQTTIHISLALNIPTVCYWNKNDWAIADDARPYFEALEQGGIILQDGEKAALKVNQVWDHLEDWWNSSNIQKARIAWCHEYARTEMFWWWAWIKTLWKI